MLLSFNTSEWDSSDIAVILTILGGVGWITYQLIRFSNEFSTLNKSFIGVEKKVNVMWNFMVSKWGTEMDTAQSYSPIKLNEKGRDIWMNSKLKDVMTPYYEEIRGKIDQFSNKNAYQIQQNTFNVIREYLSNDEILDVVEPIAYEHGTQPYDVIMVYALIVRDIILKEKGYSVDDTDNPYTVHTP